MKLKYILLFFLICSLSFSQNLKELELIGTWEVQNVESNFSNISKEQQQVIDKLITAFDNAVFQFEDNKHFNIIIDFDNITNQMKNAYWKFDPTKSIVTMVDWTDKDTDEPSWE